MAGGFATPSEDTAHAIERPCDSLIFRWASNEHLQGVQAEFDSFKLHLFESEICSEVLGIVQAGSATVIRTLVATWNLVASLG